MNTSFPKRRLRAWIARFAAVAVVVSGLTGFALASDPGQADAAVASSFDPGNIISDANFYNANALSAAQVQSFLEQVVPTCRSGSGPACLRNYSQDTPSIAAVAGRCSALGGGVMTAAQIVDSVARACNISQKVLLVLLEKEQGLVSSTAPSAYAYTHATGFACPDTAACDPRYNGFFAQVYAAGLQFQRYKATPTSWGYQAGRTNTILYNPAASCGTKQVYIQNQATAALYIYTPYTPNQAALNNLYGTGDSCSSYGNRNFWRLYTDWFGSTTGGNAPTGAITSINSGLGQATVSGWAVDPDSTGAIRVDMYIDGKGAASVQADVDTPSLAGQLGSSNTKHGFSATVSGLSTGTHEVCAWGINVGAGANTQFECQRFTIDGGSPIGVIDGLTTAADTVSVRGWALDPDTAAAVTVAAQIDGVTKATWTANQQKSGLNAAKPGFGDAHAYSGTISGIGSGSHTLCIVASNAAGPGSATAVACRDFSRPTGSPTLNIDEASSASPGALRVRGWAIDPDTTAAVRVHIYVDDVLQTKVTADAEKASLATAFPGYGANHQFTADLTGLAPSVTHQVCLAAIDQSGGQDSTWSCRAVAQPTGSPMVNIDQASATDIGVLTMRGWAIDPDVVTPTDVAFTVDGKNAGSTTANVAKASLATAFPGYGANHQFTATLRNIGPGDHTVCTTVSNSGGGGPTTDCRTVPMLSGSPTLLPDEVSSNAAGAITLRGWALDPDTTDPVRIDTYVDGKGASSIPAGDYKASLASTFGAAYGGNHQFAQTLTGFSSGSHQVCMYAINVGAGGNTAYCATVSVR